LAILLYINTYKKKDKRKMFVEASPETKFKILVVRHSMRAVTVNVVQFQT